MTTPMTADAVGVVHLRTDEGMPVRVFYPARKQHEDKRTPWFRVSFGYYLGGYLSAFMERGTWKFNAAVRLVRFLAHILPPNYATIPSCYSNALPAKHPNRHLQPLVVFSHGLTGTGEENSTLLARWAREGCVVVCCHHTDGSSSRVPLATGESLWYERTNFKNYDPEFRPKQVHYRMGEVLQAVAFALKSDRFPQSIQQNIDPEKVILAGFSYGAATSALTAALHPEAFTACILLDGWFYIDVMKSANMEFKFPAEVHELGIRIPCMFINSQQFMQVPKLQRATADLIAKCPRADARSLPGTTHSNFVSDLTTWLPSVFLWIAKRAKVLGTAEPQWVDQEVEEGTSSFIRSQL